MEARAECAGFREAGEISTSITAFEVTFPNGHVEWHEAKGEWTLLAALKLEHFRLEVAG